MRRRRRRRVRLASGRCIRDVRHAPSLGYLLGAGIRCDALLLAAGPPLLGRHLWLLQRRGPGC